MGLESLPRWGIGLLAAVVLLLGLLMWRRRKAGAAEVDRGAELDTVLDWPPTAAPLLDAAERRAYDLLRRALPDYRVLAQVTLARFIRVPRRQSYVRWMGRAGQLSADLLVCSTSMQVLAVIELQPLQPSEGARARLARLQRVLQAAGIKVAVWPQGRLPPLEEVRELLGLTHAAPTAFDAEGFMESTTGETDPDRLPSGVPERPSTWFDDFEDAPPRR